MKKQFGDYYLGLDVGTNSVGWAVTDLNYNVLKFNGKSMWGIRLFDEAQTAAGTRVARSQRRRIERQTWRVKLVQELLSLEISKIDMGFYQRLAESNLHPEDKKVSPAETFTLFGRNGMSDKEYFDKYPTIYHLRQAMLQDKADAFDIRFLYLVVSHFMKHRGHFLFPDLQVGESPKFSVLYDSLVNYIKNNLDGMEEWNGGNKAEVERLLTDKNISLSYRKKLMETAIGAKTKPQKALAAFLSGSSSKLSDLFDDELLKEEEKNSFGFATCNFEELSPALEECLGERFELIEMIKAIYDWSLLCNILKGNQFLADAKVAVYEEHKHDLQVLKKFVREKGTSITKKIFGIPVKDCKNYSAYVGTCHNKNGHLINVEKKATQAELCDFLKKELKEYHNFSKEDVLPDNANEVDKLFFRIGNGTAFPRQVTKENGVVPMQVNVFELQKILGNATKHHEFLGVKDESGLTVAEKILSIMNFRIPYYVGPLAGNKLSRDKKRCWVVRRNSDKITPWNFDKVVDKAKCAEAFILNMTNKCTYLEGEDVLPKHSLLYAEFMVRNELNNLRIDGTRLRIEIIESIYQSLVLHGNGKITKKKIQTFLRNRNFVEANKEANITGVDDALQADAKAYKDFERIFGAGYVVKHVSQIEEIIKLITLFADEKAMLWEKIHALYPDIDNIKLKDICRLKYKDWGRLSKTLLNSSKVGYIDDSTGEVITVIEAMRREPLNLMELLSNNCRYGFIEKIKEFNNGDTSENGVVNYEMVDKMHISPAVKRAVWQTMNLVNEITGITGHSPKRAFVEVAREEGKKERTKSRKDFLLDLYKQVKDDEVELLKELKKKLNEVTEENLRGRKFFLYFTQLGRCMYCGKQLNIEELYDKKNGLDVYEKDHIFPRSKTKDDSLDNLVLVHQEENQGKKDVYPLNPEIQKEMLSYWTMLKNKGLIRSGKFERLTRCTPLTNEELAGFINRQLVETRQSTNAIISLLGVGYPDCKTVWSKAGHISDFRQEFDFVKCRDINDLHHAKDAYLNIVVGNAYHDKFTGNPYKFINEGNRYTLNTDEMFKRDIKHGDNVGWVAGDNGTIATVAKIMSRNDILYTRMPIVRKGEIFKLKPLGKGKGQVPLKQGMDIQKYGGYNKASIAYFMLVKSLGKKGKIIKTIEAVPILLKGDTAKIMEYLKVDVGLTDPQIILPMIKCYSLLKVNGFLMHITGKTGNQISGMPATQMLLGKDDELYIKKIKKFVERLSKNKEKDKSVKVNERDGITVEQNLSMYDLMRKKQAIPGFVTRPAAQIKVLDSGRVKFLALTIEKQCVVLNNILLWLANKTDSVDLSLIGGTTNGGTVKRNKDITDCREVMLYNQSPTGLFEQRIDLLKL